MINQAVFDTAAEKFVARFGRPHTVAAYAPGRVEGLGNHTDYNEGLVLSAAINFGTFFLCAPSGRDDCQLMAGNIDATSTFSMTSPTPDTTQTWANYVRGVAAGLDLQHIPHGCDALFVGNIPLGAGLSSSASLEISAAMALATLYGKSIAPLELAKIAQRAEHEFVGVKCGLLDQLSSLFGQDQSLIMTDVRSLQTDTIALPDNISFLMCNTGVKHALVDGEYNERRQHCEAAAAAFADLLDHPVRALRDVSWAEWENHHAALDALTARRAAHPIGENDRVTRARQSLDGGDLKSFGALMFESHVSSQTYFENSCVELDFLVETARNLPGV
ncbi:MAG: galactokinase, partial [Verrucomicrobia bacterium]|nr:galactokinase [Verrucomicrobiota bacterium]